jgi:hypothetical protein
MSNYFGHTTIEDLYLALQKISGRLDNIENRKDQILPLRDSTRLPDGMEGQMVLAPENTLLPTNTQVPTYYADGIWQQVSGGTGGGTTAIDWIYVGTTGIGIDTLLAANPHPFATGDTPGPPPFITGTTIPQNPLAFALVGTPPDAALLLAGGFTGVALGQQIFQLPNAPTNYRPLSDQPIGFEFSDFSKRAAAMVQASGYVVYHGSYTVTYA